MISFGLMVQILPLKEPTLLLSFLPIIRLIASKAIRSSGCLMTVIDGELQ